MTKQPPRTAPEIRWLDSLALVNKHQWNRLAGGDPFLSYEFLWALEQTECIGAKTAWRPHYLTAYEENDQLIAAMPLYLKFDSRGEFVFDWGWADAFERAGRPYYPKLLSAIPFTPATGQRLLISPEADRSAVSRIMLDACRKEAATLNASSIHILFPKSTDCTELEKDGFLARKGYQFHWHNNNYSDFDAFLATFTSSKRKKVRRERRRIAEYGITFDHLTGDDMQASDWDTVYDFYSRTFMRRGRMPYLNKSFFEEIAHSIPNRLLVIQAKFENQSIAAAICFRSNTTLYGRYWGSLADFHSLHFETCYYQGIEYCINNGLQYFEPGTQGEHKISRGFSPTATWSYHRILDSEFHDAVGEFLNRETTHVDDYMTALGDHIPYKNTD